MASFAARARNLKSQLQISVAALEALLSEEYIAEICEAVGHRWRTCFWRPAVVILTFLRQVLAPNCSCRQTVAMSLADSASPRGVERTLPPALAGGIELAQPENDAGDGRSALQIAPDGAQGTAGLPDRLQPDSHADAAGGPHPSDRPPAAQLRRHAATPPGRPAPLVRRPQPPSPDAIRTAAAYRHRPGSAAQAAQPPRTTRHQTPAKELPLPRARSTRRAKNRPLRQTKDALATCHSSLRSSSDPTHASIKSR